MNTPAFLRTITLVISAAAMCMGILAITGLLVPRNLPQEYGWILGAVVFLYGAYRFSMTFFRKRSG